MEFRRARTLDESLDLLADLGEDACLLAGGTDGSDGPTEAGGAFADGGTVERGRAAGVAAAELLADNDSHRFFSHEGGLVVTGPTATNVMHLALLWIQPVAA